MMNKQKGNMYPFVTHTWNPIKGECPHYCNYCYMKQFPQGKLRLDEKALKDNLGDYHFIFIGSSTDMFAEEIPNEWILSVLGYIRKYPKNTYLLQSKNPKRFLDFYDEDCDNIVYGTTIETNREIGLKYSKAPPILERVMKMIQLREHKARVMVTIEPIFDFDVEELIDYIRMIKPEWINIGADSKKIDYQNHPKRR